jgi:hypothetical protein
MNGRPCLCAHEKHGGLLSNPAPTSGQERLYLTDRKPEAGRRADLSNRMRTAVAPSLSQTMSDTLTFMRPRVVTRRPNYA